MSKLFANLQKAIADIAESCACCKEPNYVSVQRDYNLSIPPRTWVTVSGYNVINANYGGGADGMTAANGTIEIKCHGVHDMLAYLRWGDVVDDYAAQVLTRFVREPYGSEPDDFGATEDVATEGRTFLTNAYGVLLTPGRTVGLQVWHNNPVPLNLEFAQFKANLSQPFV